MNRSEDILDGRVAVAMSGGVDSSVAALLLKRAGRDVVGFFLRNGVTREGPGSARSCCSVSDAADARRVAARLDVPFYALDVSGPFEGIVEEFVAAYREGRTPNPCVRCNVDVKFGRLVELARAVGASRVATGHYARVAVADGRRVLRRARDLSKDQSYVLSTLDQAQLAAAEFPLGALTKDEVRSLAREAGLTVADKPESQEICFVPSGDYRDLVRERAPETVAPGEIVTEDGEVVGRHDGVAGFTVGQRRGLGVAFGERRHVVRLEPAENRVVVGPRDAASHRSFSMRDVVWTSRAEPEEDRTAFRVVARVRHRHLGAPARARRAGPGRVRVEFEEPEFAVTPGQTAVLYVGDDVLAAGTIEHVNRKGEPCTSDLGSSAPS